MDRGGIEKEKRRSKGREEKKSREEKRREA
jgi:hypothetical protein